MAEIFNEFDEPSPHPAVYCQRISREEFDQRSAQNTQAELDSLLNYLEANPNQFYQILRKRKADNLNLFELIKVKLLNKLQDNYLEKYFSEEECRKDLDNLKQDMASAFNYGQEAKGSGLRFSRRLAEKRTLKPLDSSTPKKLMTPPPPPPPPPPPLLELKSFMLPVPQKRTSKYTSTPSGTFNKVCNDSLIQSIRNVQPRRKLRETMNAAPLNHAANESLSLRKETHSIIITRADISLARGNLRSRRPASSPDGSPYQLCRARKENEPPSGDKFSLFNQQLVDKFRNARSPSNSPSGNLLADSGFESP